MKNVWKVLGILCLVFVIASCSKDDDPANNDLFVGTYNGSVGFNDDESNISADSSSVTVVKVGDDYNFKFNESGIPALTGVEFKEDGDNGIINIDFEEGVQVVRIDESNLTIMYSEDGQTWTANCTR
ncbi:MAG TPA: hypothetical protein VK084_00140 [Chitinophagaceae bacterium]|nr:hypothetical protein [Chitinophagaceae bacterium]